MSAVAECQAAVDASKTGGIAVLVPAIDSIAGTGYPKIGVWSVRLSEWLEFESQGEYFEYARHLASESASLPTRRSTVTGDALLDRLTPFVHDGANFYTSIGGFLDLHQEVLPNVRPVTLRQSRRLTEVLFRDKLVRRLE